MAAVGRGFLHKTQKRVGKRLTPIFFFFAVIIFPLTAFGVGACSPYTVTFPEEGYNKNLNRVYGLSKTVCKAMLWAGGPIEAAV